MQQRSFALAYRPLSDPTTLQGDLHEPFHTNSHGSYTNSLRLCFVPPVKDYRSPLPNDYFLD